MQAVRVPMEELVTLLKMQMADGGRGQLTVVGTSMQPLFKSERDRVLLELPKTLPQKGDIILYQRRNGRYVLHRIVAVRQDICFCCGDNQWQKEQVGFDQVIAVVTGFVRKDKQYTLREKGYRLYVKFWVATRPLRRPLFAVRKLLSKCKRTLLR